MPLPPSQIGTAEVTRSCLPFQTLLLHHLYTALLLRLQYRIAYPMFVALAPCTALTYAWGGPLWVETHLAAAGGMPVERTLQ
jgi:hypothetical protein